MKSLKITLALAVLTALFVLTVSSVSKDNVTNTPIEKIDKSEHDMTTTIKKKKERPSNA